MSALSALLRKEETHFTDACFPPQLLLLFGLKSNPTAHTPGDLNKYFIMYVENSHTNQYNIVSQ